MQIEVKGRNVSVTEDLREHVEKRFTKVSKQVSDLARLEIELKHERNPSQPEREVVEATLSVKGRTLRARDTARDFKHAVNLCERSCRGRSSVTATSGASGANPRCLAPQRHPAGALKPGRRHRRLSLI